MNQISQSNPGWAARLLRNYGRAEKNIAVGFPSDSPAAGAAYPDGTRVVEVAVDNEFGTAIAPARPFLAKSEPALEQAQRDILSSAVTVINEGQNVDREMNLLGQMAVGIVQTTITELRDPPNTAYTIKRKGGSSNPLMDTGLMRRTVNYSIR